MIVGKGGELTRLPLTAETRQVIEEPCQQSCKGLETSQRNQLHALLEQYTDTFADRVEDCMHTSLVQHDIDT